ncbi:MAG: Rrf2 family transcriptional regulator [Cyclobacteriaceae bacterium]|nr:Rrf2 family transcriptional regulator [Cyclobacteriaceae bacterium]
MFSKACEYAIRAVIYICHQSKNGERVGLKEIAKRTDSPEAFMAKILQKLVKNGIVSSLKGPTGGFVLDKEQQEKIRLVDIVYAIDGDNVFNGCGLGLRECSEEQPCPIHDKFKNIRNGLSKMLHQTTIHDLAEGLSTGTSYLRI